MTARVLLALGLLASAPAALAQEEERGLYFRLDTGYAWSMNAEFRDREPGWVVCDAVCNQGQMQHLGTSAVFGAGIGWRFSPQLRADLTYSQRSFAIDGISGLGEHIAADVNSSVTMLTGYWDIPVEAPVRPFIGLGIGMARNSMGITTITNPFFPGALTASAGKESSTAYSFTVGAGMKVFERATIEVGYRYMDLGKFQTGNTFAFGPFATPFPGTEGKLRTNELTLGLRF